MSESLNFSQFLKFETGLDAMRAEANDMTVPGISFLRLEFGRVRPGMASFLLKVATPKSPGAEKSNSKIVLRCDRKQMTASGLRSTARTIIKQMQENGDSTADWSTVNEELLARMLASPIKFFAGNTGAQLLQLTTEALP